MDEQDLLRKAYDSVADAYLDSRTKGKGISGFYNREIERPAMFSLVPENLDEKLLLDVGCGPGIHMKEYQARGASTFGVDLSARNIENGKAYCPDGNFQVGSVYDLPFADGMFDIVTASLVLDHVSELQQAASEVKRVLAPNGSLIFSVPHPAINIFNEDFSPVGDYFQSKPILISIAGGEKIFPDFPRTIQDYVNLFIESGFSLERMKEIGVDPSLKEEYPKLVDRYMNVPVFCLYKWLKK